MCTRLGKQKLLDVQYVPRAISKTGTSPAQLTCLTRRCDLLNVFVPITGLLASHGELVIFPFTVALLADAPTNVSSDRLSQIRSN